MNSSRAVLVDQRRPRLKTSARREFAASKLLIALFFLMLLGEGALRKWVFSGADFLIQGIRDALPMVALMAYFLERRGSASNPANRLQALPASFFPYLALAIMSSVFSGQRSYLIPLLGLRTHFAYVPLALLIPAVAGTGLRIRQGIGAILILGLPICALAIYQTTQSQFSEINIYASREEADATFGEAGLVRATGTFSYIAGMAVFAQLVAVCSLFFYAIADKVWVRAFAFLTFLLGIVAAVSTGSRGALFGIMAQLILVVILCPSISARFGRKVIIRYFLVGAAAVWLAVAVAPEQVHAFLERVDSSSGDEGGRIWDILFQWTDALAAHPLGEGVGSGHLGAATLIGVEREFIDYEDELSRIAYELGLLGFASFAVFRIAVILTGVRALKNAKAFEHRLLAAVALSFLLMNSAGAMYTPMANAFYWTALGVVYLIARQRAPHSA